MEADTRVSMKYNRLSAAKIGYTIPPFKQLNTKDKRYSHFIETLLCYRAMYPAVFLLSSLLQ